MEKKSSTSIERKIMENIAHKKISFMLIFILIIFSGFLLFNQLPGISKFVKTVAQKEKKENVI
jgi:hypothetical protein